MKKNVIPVVLAVILLLWLGWRLIQPIMDADIFWQMAYAKQMIARHTLRPDHTLYSWMPSSNRMIYCAWLSEFLLLGLWNWMGINGLVVLRYGGMLLTVVLPGCFAWRLGILRQPLAWLLILFSTMGGLAASQPKPELFSLLMWHAILFCYFNFRLAIREKTNPAPWLYAVPVLMLLWVNLHGGFILAAPFLALTLAIERPFRWDMAWAWTGALIATAITPYGLRYPLQLIQDYLLNRTPRPDVSWNSAHQSAFSDAGFAMYLPEFLVFMILTWIVLRTDWRLAALNLIYVPLYVVYLRSSFLLPILFAYSILWLVSERPVPAKLQAASAFLFLLLIGSSVFAQPDKYSWTGFGYSYWLPLEETEFLAQANLGPRLYNLFDSGGYLLWRLYPQYQVMTDSRSFPYLSWFQELYDFTRKDSQAEFQQFLLRHPANAALIDLKEHTVWWNFLKAPGWYPVFYGPSAAVFVKNQRPAGIGRARGIIKMRSADAALNVFDFAVAVADYGTAWAALDQLKSANSERLEADRQYREAHVALRAGNYARAEQLFMTALQGKTVSDRDALVLTLLRSLREAATMSPRPNVDQIPPALQELAAPD